MFFVCRHSRDGARSAPAAWPVSPASRLTMRAKKSTSEECQVGCPIRRSRDQRLLSSPPGLSQSATSFIASHRQGIHQTPFSRLIRSRRRTIVLRNSQLQPANASAITGLGQCIDLERLSLVVLPLRCLRTSFVVLSASACLRTSVHKA